MDIPIRRILIVAALFAIAGCSSNATTPATSSSLPTQQALTFVHHGMPFIPPVVRHNAVPRQAAPASYSTKKSLVFEGDQAQAAVNVYQTKNLANNPAPIATIHVASGCPYGMAMDKTGTLYVADNCGGNDVEEYAKGSTNLSATITDGISNPLGLAIDKNGTLYVSNYPASITEYPYGSTTPAQTITGGGLTNPFGLALDSSGNLYIADFGADAVFELPAGGSSVMNLNLQSLGEPIGLAIDQKKGLLWETDGADKVVNIYKLGGSTSPIQQITSGFTEPYAISLQNKGKPKRTVVISDLYDRTSGQGSVFAFKGGQYTPYATLTNTITLPTGLLITKP
jgi:sugar lactone lactonase YvrE